MKKVLYLLFACVLCCALALTACAGNEQQAADEPADEVTEEDETQDIAKMVIGKWSMKEKDGEPVPTNEKTVLNFVSAGNAHMSTLFSEVDNTAWGEGYDMEVTIDGDKITLTRGAGDDELVVDEITVSEITDSEMNGSLVVKKVKDGTEEKILEQQVGFVKIDEDYSEDIKGTWEGHRTSEAGDYDNGEEHRWEYKDDGTFVYYLKEGDDWVPADQKISDYFVDGDLLCTKWENDDGQGREWWEISIDGDKMSWTALRVGDDDKTTYTATFEMTRVEE